jgi:alpha-N-arabinofuranosidase
MEKNCSVGGMMAPTLRYNKGTFYIICANFSDRGNFIITTEDPRGPWSEPHWLTDVPGIDASIFFDDDGKAYIMGTGDVWENEGGRMERGIWLAEYDMENFRLKSEPVTIFNSALRVGSSPEAPHLYHVGDYYHLIIAEGGTEHYHAVMDARSKDLFGFYEGNPANPVLTHRHMGYGCPITNVGHADLVELPDGSWYAVMLASRLIDGVGKNLGRETFICPVKWERDWPFFSPETGKVEWEYDAPECLPWTEYPEKVTRYDFEEDDFGPEWVNWGVPYEKICKVQDSKLFLQCKRQGLDEPIRPMGFEPNFSKEHFVSMFAQRQCHIDETVAAMTTFEPRDNESAGLAIIQAMNHQLHVERVCKDGEQLLQCVITGADYDKPPYIPGFESRNTSRVLAETLWDKADIVLQIEMKHEQFTVRYGSSEDDLMVLAIADGKEINPEKVGCMTGTIIGMFASGNGTESSNFAAFDFFELS